MLFSEIIIIINLIENSLAQGESKTIAIASAWNRTNGAHYGHPCVSLITRPLSCLLLDEIKKNDPPELAVPWTASSKE